MAQTKAQQMQESRQRKTKKAIPQWVRVVLNITFVLPVVMLFLYVTGIWDITIIDGKVVRDDLDNIVVSFCLFAGIGGIIILNVLLNAYTEEE